MVFQLRSVLKKNYSAGPVMSAASRLIISDQDKRINRKQCLQQLILLVISKKLEI